MNEKLASPLAESQVSRITNECTVEKSALCMHYQVSVTV